MKKFNLMMILLLIVTSISAQTFDLGEGRKATLDQAGNYKVTWNQKTDNGGTVVGTFTGVIKDGKRNGAWVGRITYTNFYMTNGNSKSGITTISRVYTGGKANGIYTYNHNVNVRTCRYDIFNKRWVYGQPQLFKESVTGSFKDGQPHGKFNCSRSTFLEKITMSFDSGKPSGDWSIQNEGITTIGFKNGFVIKNKFMDANGSGEELVYTSTEDIESLPNRQTVLVTDAIPYFTYYLQGGEFTNWFDQYPKNSSEEDFSKISYVLADYNNHIQLVGNVTQAQKDAFKENKKQEIASKIEEQNAIKQRQIENDAYAALIPFFNLYKYYDGYDKMYYKAIGVPEFYEIYWWEDQIKHVPQLKEYTRYSNELSKVFELIKNKSKYAEKAKLASKKIKEEMGCNHVPEMPDSVIMKIVAEKYDNKKAWESFLESYAKKYAIEEYVKLPIIDNDIIVYLLHKEYIKYKFDEMIIVNKKPIVTKEDIIAFRKNLYIDALTKNMNMNNFAYDNRDYYNAILTKYDKNDKKFAKFIDKIKKVL